MELTVRQLAEEVDGKVSGDGSRVIRGVAGLEEATSTDVSFLRDNKNAGALKSYASTGAGAVIVAAGTASNGRTLVEVKNPVAAFAKILELIAREKAFRASGVHPSAFIASTATLGRGVSIGPFCVIEDHAAVGDGARLVSHVYVGPRSKIGAESLLYPQAVIREDVKIGDRCVIHAGAVLGSDGYGFYFENGRHNKIPQVGTVIVEDDVEIGSCTTIDRATTGATVIRGGSKIDNLVQIAHNVEVGANSLIVAQAGIAGSSRLGKGVVLAGQVGVADHVTIGDGAQIGAQSGIKEDVKPGEILFGSPAQPLGETLRQMFLVRRLPELFKDLKKLKESVSKDRA